MKKNYIAPETDVTKIKLEKSLMVGTNPNVTLDRSLSVNAEEVESREIYYPKNYNVWDE